MFDCRSRLEALFVPLRAAPLLLGTAVLLTGLIVGACDQVSGPAPDIAGSDDPSPSGLLPDTTVRLVPIGPNSRLLPPGADQHPRPDGAVNTAQPGSSNTNRQDSTSDPIGSPYGCVMSTPNLQGDASYRYESVYAFFPERTVEAADGDTRKVDFQMNSRTAYTEGTRPVAHILRRATCRIPDTDEAERLVRKRLEQFPPPSTAQQGKAQAGSSKQAEETSTWSGVPVSSPGGCSPGPSGPASKDVVCTDYTYTLDYCITWKENTECYYEATCNTYEWDEDDGGGGSCENLLVDCGEDPSGCNADGGTDQLCESGEGPAEDQSDINVDPCDLENPPDYCDEAGSCYDANIGNRKHESILQSLESSSAIANRWSDTNAEASNQDDRAEKNSFIIYENGNYRAEPFSEYGNITTTSCTIHGNVNVPSNAVGILHFQPFKDGERITSKECLKARNLNPNNYIGSNATRKATYNSEPSNADTAMAKQFGLDTYVMDKDKITVVSEKGKTEGEYSRCGY